MRDIKRIEAITNKFKELWELSPDLRFGQLITGIFSKMASLYHFKDPFFPEDDLWLNVLNTMIEERKDQACK